MSETQAWKYECPCGDESETFQDRDTAETARRNHHIQCEETPEVVGVPYVADGGLGVSDAGPDQNPPGDAMMTDGGSHTVKACPECDSSNIRINTPGSIHGLESGGRCYCCTCEQYFDEPVERQSQGRSNTPAAGEETLKEMDPDELLTDGGTDLPELTLDDRLRDEDNDDEGAFVRVVEHHTDERADEFPVYETDDGNVETVYDYHRGRVDPDDSVVDVVYEESLVDALGADIVPATRDPDAAAISNDERRRRLLHFLQDYPLDSFVANGRKVTVYSFPRSRLTPVAHAGDGDPGGDDDPRPDGGVAAAEFMSDGGDETLPSETDWPYAAVVFGADVDPDCTALTGEGKPCSFKGYLSNDLPVCNTHAGVDDPDIVSGAHQWATISDRGDRRTVCVRCEAVWEGQEPETAVACPTCGAEPGMRCGPVGGAAGSLPPHPERRELAYQDVDGFEQCPENHTERGRQGKLVSDGGVDAAGRDPTIVQDLTAFKINALAAITRRVDDPATEDYRGTRLKEDLESRGYGEVRHGRLYPNLDDLVERGLIEKRTGEIDDRSNAYYPTQKGRLALEQHAQRLAGAAGLNIQQPDATPTTQTRADGGATAETGTDDTTGPRAPSGPTIDAVSVVPRPVPDGLESAIERVDTAEEQSDEEALFHCGGCGHSSETERGVKIHQGHSNQCGDADIRRPDEEEWTLRTPDGDIGAEGIQRVLDRCDSITQAARDLRVDRPRLQRAISKLSLDPPELLPEQPQAPLLESVDTDSDTLRRSSAELWNDLRRMVGLEERDRSDVTKNELMELVATTGLDKTKLLPLTKAQIRTVLRERLGLHGAGPIAKTDLREIHAAFVELEARGVGELGDGSTDEAAVPDGLDVTAVHRAARDEQSVARMAERLETDEQRARNALVALGRDDDVQEDDGPRSGAGPGEWGGQP